MAAQRKKFAIIDGKSVFYRGYYALPNLSTKDGTPTGGVYGFATMALEVLKRLKPDYVAVAWDKPKTNIRKRLEMYPKYKAGRKAPPPDFYAQLPILRDLLKAFGWPLYELDDYEADDIMGALSVQAKAKDIETMLITSDLDALQLINSHTHVYALKKGLSNIELFHPDSFAEKYGLTPEQFLDLKALKGDSSDNIPGVPGIGEKTAIGLLKEFNTLDGVYDNLDLIKQSVRAKLEAGKDLADLSKKLAAIWIDAPIKLNLKEVDGSKCDPLEVQKMLQKLEFRSLVRQLPEAMKIPGEPMHSNGDFKHSGDAAELLESDAHLGKLDFKDTNELFVHSWSAGKHGRGPVYMLISPDAKKTYAVDLRKVSPEALNRAIGDKSLIGSDIKTTQELFLGLDLPMPKLHHDVLVGAFLINSLRREQSLTDLAANELGYQSSLDNLPPEEFLAKSGEIIEVIAALYKQQAEELKKLPKVSELADRIEWPVIGVIARMEYEGIKLDAEYLTLMSEKLSDAVSDLEQQIYGYADQEFNIASPSQLAEILFSKLNLPTEGIKKGKTGYSTAATELAKLREIHPIIDFISQYREVTKLKNTYVDTLPNMVDDKSRLHTTYNLTTAQTGRLSSVDPNLQNIPVRTELGKEIRTAFVPETGHIFINADYSQFELRLAAYLSGDDELIEMFNKDVDVHTATAAEIYGREEQDVTKNMRRDAKVVNFGVMYGLGAHGLTQATGMTYEQAAHFIKRFFEVRPKLKEYIDKLREDASEKGYVENIFGRRRPTPDVKSSNFPVREAAYRAAVNMPFQGSAADIMKLAMVKVQEKFDEITEDKRPKILLQIHDSLIVEAPASDAEKIAKLLKETMENVHKLPVNLTVDTAIGKTWGDL